MPGNTVDEPAQLRTGVGGGRACDEGHDASRLPQNVPRNGGSALWDGDARAESRVPAPEKPDADQGPLPGGRQHPPGPGHTNGRDIGAYGGSTSAIGPELDQKVDRGGYIWWYVDAISDDGSNALTLIACIGSVFSPYYAWSKRDDPYDHCAINIALYGKRGSRWAMTERRSSTLCRDNRNLQIGPSALRWENDVLVADVV